MMGGRKGGRVGGVERGRKGWGGKERKDGTKLDLIYNGSQMEAVSFARGFFVSCVIVYTVIDCWCVLSGEESEKATRSEISFLMVHTRRRLLN